MQETKETIGQRLKQIRLSRQLSIEKAAEATRVRAVYLQALEEDNYSAMSSAAQGRGFLRLYADFLSLDLETAMTDLRQGGTVDALAESPAPTTPPPAPVAAPPTPPASPADGKPGRGGFWSRLLRRPVPAPVAQSETSPVVAEEPAPAPSAAPEPVIVPASSLAKHPEGAKEKKDKAPVQVDKPKSKPRSTAKTTAKTADKKKASLKNRQ